MKKEQFDSELEPGPGHVSLPWEIYGSWVDTTDSSQKSAELVIPFVQRSQLLRRDSCDYDENRTQREFVPDQRKDNSYWAKRLKNNASARRSRLKKKAMEKHMETKLQELQRENIELKYELAALKRHFAGQLDSKSSYDEGGSDMSMRTGSASDTSDSSSVTSEGDNYNGHFENDNVVASPLSALTTSTINHHLASSMAFPFKDGFHIPFNYSFMQYSVADKNRKDNGNSPDNEVEALAKIPHKFRYKKDFHSAFYAQQFTDNKA